MKHKFIETKNFLKFRDGIESLKNIEDEDFKSARMGLFYGSYGIGKTWAIEKIAISERNGILFLRAEEVWTKGYLVRKIGVELGVLEGKTSEIYESIKNKLLYEEKIIVIDEVDKLLNSKKHELLEVFRDISDQTGCVIIFIGMEQSARKWQTHGHYFSRLRLFPMEKTDLDDIKNYCSLSDVELSNDLIEHFYTKLGNLRLIKRQIEAIEEECLKRDLESFDLEDYIELRKENKL
ncbi:MAG: AAA family ATPase [Sphaerochaetaceae bacterium]|nr:AAA family ATPase [Sphaerochaetaceae bacterium]